MEGQPYGYPGQAGPANNDPGQDQFNAPPNFQQYPSAPIYAQYQMPPVPFPSQYLPMDQSLATQASPSSYNHLVGSDQITQTRSGPGFPQTGPFSHPYGQFQRGDTIGDPVSLRDESGRLWQNYRPDKYFLPHDAIEQDRLDFTHRGFVLQLQRLQDPRVRNSNPEDALHLAPIQGDPARVLDMGTGTGIWAIEYARRHPGSQVVGSDLSLIQPDVSAAVPNVSFVREDVEEEWVYDAPFDFIHARLMFSCFVSHRDVLRRAFHNLRPGGWIEYQDLGVSIDSDDDSHRGTALHKWVYIAQAGAAAKGRDFEAPRKYKDYMLEAGFVDVVEVKFRFFGNGWPATEPERTIGKYMSVSGSEAVRSISGKLLGEGLGLPDEVVQPITAQAQKDVLDENIHYWWPGYVVYGRKPFGHEKMPPPSR